MGAICQRVASLCASETNSQVWRAQSPCGQICALHTLTAAIQELKHQHRSGRTGQLLSTGALDDATCCAVGSRLELDPDRLLARHNGPISVRIALASAADPVFIAHIDGIFQNAMLMERFRTLADLDGVNRVGPP